MGDFVDSYSDNLDEDFIEPTSLPSSASSVSSDDSIKRLINERIKNYSQYMGFDDFQTKFSGISDSADSAATIKDLIDDMISYSVEPSTIHRHIITHCNLHVLTGVLHKYSWQTPDLLNVICTYPDLVEAYELDDLDRLVIVLDNLPKHISRHIKYALLRCADNALELLANLSEFMADFRELFVDVYNQYDVRGNFHKSWEVMDLDKLILNMTVIEARKF